MPRHVDQPSSYVGTKGRLGIAQLLEGCLHDNNSGVGDFASFNCYKVSKQEPTPRTEDLAGMIRRPLVCHAMGNASTKAAHHPC